jgi:hypothetical protein
MPYNTAGLAIARICTPPPVVPMDVANVVAVRPMRYNRGSIPVIAYAPA